jgi:hypothetical protein
MLTIARLILNQDLDLNLIFMGNDAGGPSLKLLARHGFKTEA